MNKTGMASLKLQTSSRRATADESKVPSSVAVCPVTQAIAALNNNSTKVVSETKLGTTCKVVYNTEVLATLRGLFPSTKPYRFQIHTNSTVTSSGAGVVQVASPASPAVVTYLEWSALSALFDECRLLKSTLGITSASIQSNKAIPLWIAFDHITSTAVGVGFGNVQRLAESECVNSLWMTGGSGRFRKSCQIASNRLFALTSSTTSTTSDIGLNGQWDISGQDATAIGVIVVYADVMNVVEFRNRA